MNLLNQTSFSIHYKKITVTHTPYTSAPGALLLLRFPLLARGLLFRAFLLNIAHNPIHTVSIDTTVRKSRGPSSLIRPLDKTFNATSDLLWRLSVHVEKTASVTNLNHVYLEARKKNIALGWRRTILRGLHEENRESANKATSAKQATQNFKSNELLITP